MIIGHNNHGLNENYLSADYLENLIVIQFEVSHLVKGIFSLTKRNLSIIDVILLTPEFIERFLENFSQNKFKHRTAC